MIFDVSRTARLLDPHKARQA